MLAKRYFSRQEMLRAIAPGPCNLPIPPFAHAGEVLESTACNRFPFLCRKLTGHAKAENPQGNQEAIPADGIRQGQSPAFGYQSPGIRHVEEAKTEPAWNDQCRQDSFEIDSPCTQWQQQLSGEVEDIHRAGWQRFPSREGP